MTDTERLEAIWWNRVEAAHLRVRRAQARLTDIRKELQSGGLSSSDRLYRAQNREELFALREYRLVLQAYLNFVVTGKARQEPDTNPLDSQPSAGWPRR